MLFSESGPGVFDLTVRRMRLFKSVCTTDPSLAKLSRTREICTNGPHSSSNEFGDIDNLTIWIGNDWYDRDKYL